MRLRGKHISEIEEEDIVSLIENKVSESITLEYKRRLPNLKNDRDKLKFLSLISSFANKSGGTIIYGIEEDKDDNDKNTGIPKTICGLGGVNFDQVKLQMEQIVSAGLQPSILNLLFRKIDVESKEIIIIGVSRSLLAPHIIWFEKNGKFYTRTNSGRLQMDVNELRMEFLRTSAWKEKAEIFRKKRIEIIVNNEHGIPVKFNNPFIIHILPLGDDRPDIDVSQYLWKFAAKTGDNKLKVEGFNFDGGYIHTVPGGYSPRYILLFRNGGGEYVTEVPQIPFEGGVGNITTVVRGDGIEKYAIDILKGYIEFSNEIPIEPPLVMFIALENVRGKCIADTSDKGNMMLYGSEEAEASSFDRNRIPLPGVIIDDITKDPLSILKNAFNILWQAGGKPQSPIEHLNLPRF